MNPSSIVNDLTRQWIGTNGYLDMTVVEENTPCLTFNGAAHVLVAREKHR